MDFGGPPVTAPYDRTSRQSGTKPANEDWTNAGFDTIKQVDQT